MKKILFRIESAMKKKIEREGTMVEPESSETDNTDRKVSQEEDY
jgi:hypothetical protein